MNLMNIFHLKHFCMKITDDKSQQHQNILRTVITVDIFTMYLRSKKTKKSIFCVYYLKFQLELENHW